MNITRTTGDGVTELTIEGRVDGYWADHLDATVAELIRNGHHRIRLNLSLVTLITSAGIGVMAKYYKQLAEINGSLRVSSPSPVVQRVLEITRLGPVLIAPDAAAEAPAAASARGQSVVRDDIAFEVFDLDPRALLKCQLIGQSDRLRTSGFDEQHCFSLGNTAPLFALGVGAFGDSFADCRPRFGELISVCGATAHQPADGTNVPDYLLADGPLAPDVRVLYCLACEGAFSRLLRFEMASNREGSIGLVNLLGNCLAMAEGPGGSVTAVGMVMVAETAGLVGAALRRSPAHDNGASSSDSSRAKSRDFFAHPEVRTRLTFTAERAFARTLTLVAGLATRAANHALAPQLRPLGTTGLYAHVHAAAFPFRPLGKGCIDLKPTVSSLFESARLLGVLHLLHDDRGAGGAGESELVRGACWIGPVG